MSQQSNNIVDVGLDDGYAWTKLALPNGRLVSIPSRACMGRANVTWIDGARPRIFEYETEGQIVSAGELNGEPTYFDGYPFSRLNRAIVQHGLQSAALAGCSVQAVSGLPVSAFYLRDGRRRAEAVARKRDSLKQPAKPVDDRLPATVVFHDVIPEALAAWYDYVITESADGAQLEEARVRAPLAVVDLGGRTTDCVVVADRAVIHDASGSLRCGLLDVKRHVHEQIRARFDLEVVSERTVELAVQRGNVRLFGHDHDVSDLVKTAQGLVIERVRAETQRQLGCGAELDRILFVGGGAIALAEAICDWFPNQTTPDQAAFANARGMLKYLRYVCEADDAA